MQYSTVLLLFLFGLLASLGQVCSAQNGGIEITPIFKGVAWDAEKEHVVRQALADAVLLANAAFDDSDNLLSKTGSNNKIINFESEAAIEYWGPPSKTLGLRQRIYDTYYRATQKSRGSGWVDWWNGRYIEMYRDEKGAQCKGVDTAYWWPPTQGDSSRKYDAIIWCDPFFTVLDDHTTVEKRILADTTGKFKLNTRNMRSTATTALHQLLHIGLSNVEICEGGCRDSTQMIGDTTPIPSYKTGLAKLLAARDVQSAAQNNDNYVYFAVARYMQKKFGVYPPYPRMWSVSRTKKENWAIEDMEPGAPGRIYLVLDWKEDSHYDRFSEKTVSDAPYMMSIYPEWYPPISWPVDRSAIRSAVGKLAFSHPNIDDVVCQTTTESANYSDCVSAFATLEGLGQNAVKAHIGDRWWASVASTCAVQVHYKGDWSKCEATLSDIWAHAKDVFEGCRGAGTMGGYVPFGVPNCPATIDIVSSSQWSNPNQV